MKKLAILLGVLLVSAAHLRAQVTVEVLMDQEQYLPGETIPVAVRVANRSGQTMRLGRDENWLKFSVEAQSGYVVLKKADVPVKGEFTLESAERGTVRFNLQPYFDLTRSGTYSVIATVSIPEWNQQISSEPKSFDVIEGAKLWEQEFGMPRAPGATNAMPEMRKYALQQANYLRNQLRLYVQITDASGKISKVTPIGPMLSFGRPDPQVDRVSNLHLLYQNGPHTFNYTVVNPNGDIIVRRTYDFTSRPHLKADDYGNFEVVGGIRRVTPGDLPPPNSATNDISGTNP